MNTLTNQQVLTTLFPLVAEEVRRAEASDDVGANKMVAVLEAIKTLHTQTSAQIGFDDLAGSVKQMAESLVEYYNRIGSFKHAEQKLAA